MDSKISLKFERKAAPFELFICTIHFLLSKTLGHKVVDVFADFGSEMVRRLVTKIIRPSHPSYPISSLAPFGSEFDKLAYLVQKALEAGFKQTEETIWSAETLERKSEVAILEFLVLIVNRFHPEELSQDVELSVISDTGIKSSVIINPRSDKKESSETADLIQSSSFPIPSISVDPISATSSDPIPSGPDPNLLASAEPSSSELRIQLDKSWSLLAGSRISEVRLQRQLEDTKRELTRELEDEKLKWICFLCSTSEVQVALTCGHVICLRCLDTIKKDATPRCPFCTTLIVLHTRLRRKNQETEPEFGDLITF